MMERLQCTQCGREFILNTGCSCCAPPPGPHFCPECGAVLRGTAPAYFFSGGMDEE
jgi:hypothetical protein